VNVVDAVTVEVVLETQAECSDADRARAALSEALIAARAPAHGGARLRGPRSTSPASEPRDGRGLAHWTVSMTVTPAAGNVSARYQGSKSVEALIVDDAGTIIAQRTLTDRNARTCLPLARAVGAWASLVLDAEMVRAKDDDGSLPTPPSSSSSSSTSSSSRSSHAASGDSGAPSSTRTGGASQVSTRSAVIVTADMRAERDSSSSSSDSAPTTTNEPRATEVGSMVYIRNGMMATGGIAGVSPFAAFEVASGWILRPSMMFGRSTEGAATLSHVAGRGDVCRRIPGNYIERRGIEADLCTGFEVGVIATPGTTQGTKTTPAETVSRVGFGPSAALRGELAGGVALEVRGLFGANLNQRPLNGQAELPLVFAAAELGVSVRLP
jgi:hypothetical protein